MSDIPSNPEPPSNPCPVEGHEANHVELPTPLPRRRGPRQIALPNAPHIEIRQIVSLVALTLVLLAFAYLFYRVISPIFVPIFLGAIIALLLYPWQRRLADRLGDRKTLSAILILLGLLLTLILPTALLVTLSFETLSDGFHRIERIVEVPPERKQFYDQVAELLNMEPEAVHERLVQLLRESNRLFVAGAMNTLGNVASIGVGTFLFIISFFFFLRDGPELVQGWAALTPLEPDQDEAIRRRFGVVCRGVVLSMFLAALAQTLTLGMGMFGIDRIFGTGLGSWIGLLTLIAALCSMIPLMGVTVVWIPLAGYWIYEGRYGAAIALVLWSSLLVGQLDNVVRGFVLKGSANLHPLLGIISILGGIQFLGIAGIFVGPIVAAVLFSLMRIMKDELEKLSGPEAI